MPCPYKIILGRETALPCPLYYSGATGIDMRRGFQPLPDLDVNNKYKRFQ